MKFGSKRDVYLSPRSKSNPFIISTLHEQIYYLNIQRIFKQMKLKASQQHIYATK